MAVLGSTSCVLCCGDAKVVVAHRIIEHTFVVQGRAAAVVRALSSKVSTYLNNFVTSRTNVIERFQSLQSHGLVNLSRAYADPEPARPYHSICHHRVGGVLGPPEVRRKKVPGGLMLLGLGMRFGVSA